jgi:thiol:disulfide interchange protein
MKFALTFAVLGAAAAIARPAPVLAPFQSVGQEEEPQEKPQEQPQRSDLYDEAADGAADVKAAVARAERDGKRVLVQWGADWCGWCHLLSDALKKDEALALELRNEYELVRVDVGRFDKHLELAASLGANFKGSGVPFLTIVDGQGRALVNSETGCLECKDNGNGLKLDPTKVLALLKLYEAPRRDSAALHAAAIAEAKASGRLVLLTFGAPWCGWCHRFEDWARSDAVAPVLGKDFVFTKIDIDRTVGGQELLVATRGPNETGIPWFAFVDGDGKVVASSTTENGGNLGCPWSPEEKAAFDGLLKAHAQRISAEERTAMLGLLGDKQPDGAQAP